MSVNPLRIRTISAISFIFLIIILCNTAQAQENRVSLKSVIDGIKGSGRTVVSEDSSITYIVGRKETLYSIAKRFNTTQEEILRLNPSLKGVLLKGTVLVIHDKLSVSPVVQVKKAEAKSFSEYRIVNGDNYFQLEKRFGISKEDLIELNPILNEGFKAGLAIKIPLKKSIDTVVNRPAGSESDKEKKQVQPTSKAPPPGFVNYFDKTFNLGVFLPLCLNLSDSARLAQRTTSFFEFYSGVLLATEKCSESGMKVKLYVYDTYRDSGVVEKLVTEPEFLSLDLIIGPVYPAGQKIVAELSAKNHIPMVSPLSSDSRLVSTTPGYYLINPGREIRMEGTADYISDKFSDQNIILLDRGINAGNDKLLIDRISQKLGSAKVLHYNILADGTAGLELLLKADQENIIVLTEANEADVSVAISRLNTLSKTNKIKVIGLQEYTRMQSINIEYLHNINLQFLSPYFADYTNPKLNSFIGKYRSAFGSEPTPFSFQGYDVAMHFIASLKIAGKNFPETNPNPEVDLLQSEYSFQKLSGFGGYINRTLYIVEYGNSYDVRCAGKIAVTLNSDHGTGKQTETNGLEQ
jgi:LysM repeat protein/ABC-type branched-subunit amino acid transport system substrate-binding protein